jgi:hypothetical protein
VTNIVMLSVVIVTGPTFLPWLSKPTMFTLDDESVESAIPLRRMTVEPERRYEHDEQRIGAGRERAQRQRQVDEPLHEHPGERGGQRPAKSASQNGK